MRRWSRWIALTAAATAACAASVGCGGSQSTNSGTPAGPDGSSDATASDASSSSNDASEGTTDGATPVEASAEGGGEGGDAGSGTDADAATGEVADSGDASTATDGGGSSDAGDGATLLANGLPCTSSGGGNGITSGGACVGCDTADGGDGTSAGPDPGCTAAYGGGTVSYVCAADSCIPGNCNSNGDCTAPTGQCGFSTPNVCGGCTSDSDCPASGATAQVCNTATGACVAATSGCSGLTSGTACSVNASDVCCGAGTLSCFPGGCCVTAGVGASCGASMVCQPDQSGETTGGGICTTCTPVSGSSPTYVVDPVNGIDATGTGNNASSALCAFKTITRALQVIGSSPVAGTTIEVLNEAGVETVTVSGVSSGTPGTGQELFPIILPANVTLTNAGGAVTVLVPTAPTKKQTVGFILSGALSAIAGSAGAGAELLISGQSEGATYGVVVGSPSASLSNVIITDFAADGIDVTDTKAGAASAVTIGAGVQSNGNGIDGLTVSGASSATINPGAGAADLFDDNGMHGVDVVGAASVSATGTVSVGSPATASSVIMSGNAAAGVWIESTSTTQSVLNGIVCTGSTGGNGIRVIPGSSVQVRNSWLLGNHGSGVDIENTTGGTGTGIGNIDLGTATSGAGAGGNVLQASTGGNGVAGICLKIAASADEQLKAQGNTFGAAGSPITCTTSTAALQTAANLSCAAGVDVGGTIVHYPGDGGTGDTINVTSCTY